VKLSLGKTRIKKKQVEMMIGQNIITRMYFSSCVFVVLVNELLTVNCFHVLLINFGISVYFCKTLLPYLLLNC